MRFQPSQSPVHVYPPYPCEGCHIFIAQESSCKSCCACDLTQIQCGGCRQWWAIFHEHNHIIIQLRFGGSIMIIKTIWNQGCSSWSLDYGTSRASPWIASSCGEESWWCWWWLSCSTSKSAEATWSGLALDFIWYHDVIYLCNHHNAKPLEFVSNIMTGYRCLKSLKWCITLFWEEKKQKATAKAKAKAKAKSKVKAVPKPRGKAKAKASAKSEGSNSKGKSKRPSPDKDSEPEEPAMGSKAPSKTKKIRRRPRGKERERERMWLLWHLKRKSKGVGHHLHLQLEDILPPLKWIDVWRKQPVHWRSSNMRCLGLKTMASMNLSLALPKRPLTKFSWRPTWWPE